MHCRSGHARVYSGVPSVCLPAAGALQAELETLAADAARLAAAHGFAAEQAADVAAAVSEAAEVPLPVNGLEATASPPAAAAAGGQEEPAMVAADAVTGHGPLCCFGTSPVQAGDEQVQRASEATPGAAAAAAEGEPAAVAHGAAGSEGGTSVTSSRGSPVASLSAGEEAADAEAVLVGHATGMAAAAAKAAAAAAAAGESGLSPVDSTADEPGSSQGADEAGGAEQPAPSELAGSPPAAAAPAAAAPAAPATDGSMTATDASSAGPAAGRVEELLEGLSLTDSEEEEEGQQEA